MLNDWPARRWLWAAPRRYGIVGGSTGILTRSTSSFNGELTWQGEYDLASWMMKQQSGFRTHRD
jgi:hypothetical protein